MTEESFGTKVGHLIDETAEALASQIKEDIDENVRPRFEFNHQLFGKLLEASKGAFDANKAALEVCKALFEKHQALRKQITDQSERFDKQFQSIAKKLDELTLLARDADGRISAINERVSDLKGI